MNSALLRFLPAIAVFIFFFSCKQDGTKNETPADPVFNTPELKSISEKIAANPKDASLYYDRGNMLHRLKADSLALADFKKAISIDSSKADYYSAVGDILFEHKDIDGSAVWLEKALKLNPEDATARLKIAKLFIYSQDYNKAFAEINIVLRKNAYNTEGYFLKGIIRKDLKDTAEAISSFQTVIQIDPNYRDAAIQLGLLYSGKKDPVALKYFDNAFAMDSSDVFPLYAKALFFQNRNELEKAKDIYRSIILRDRSYSDAFFGIGWVNMQQDSFEKAAQQFKIVTQLEPDNASAYYNYGLCNEVLGNKKDALDAYKQALVFDEQYEDAEKGVKRVGGK